MLHSIFTPACSTAYDASPAAVSSSGLRGHAGGVGGQWHWEAGTLYRLRFLQDSLLVLPTISYTYQRLIRYRGKYLSCSLHKYGSFLGSVEEIASPDCMTL